MEAKLSATEQDISEVVAEICEVKEELKKCVESDKDHLRKREDHLRRKEEQLRDEKSQLREEKILLEQLHKGISSSNISSIIFSFGNFFSNFLISPSLYKLLASNVKIFQHSPCIFTNPN